MPRMKKRDLESGNPASRYELRSSAKRATYNRTAIATHVLIVRKSKPATHTLSNASVENRAGEADHSASRSGPPSHAIHGPQTYDPHPEVQQIKTHFHKLTQRINEYVDYMNEDVLNVQLRANITQDKYRRKVAECEDLERKLEAASEEIEAAKAQAHQARTREEAAKADAHEARKREEAAKRMAEEARKETAVAKKMVSDVEKAQAERFNFHHHQPVSTSIYQHVSQQQGSHSQQPSLWPQNEKAPGSYISPYPPVQPPPWMDPSSITGSGPSRTGFELGSNIGGYQATQQAQPAQYLGSYETPYPPVQPPVQPPLQKLYFSA